MLKASLYSMFFGLLIIASNCKPKSSTFAKKKQYLGFSKNILNYNITPKIKFDKSGLVFSDQGAWFGYSFPDSTQFEGFSGPFLMTQQNGIWSSKSLAYLDIKNQIWKSHKTTSYNSHLEQIFESNTIQLIQKLVFLSGHTSLIQSTIKNTSNKEISINYQWKNMTILADSLQLLSSDNQLKVISSKTDAIGYLIFPEKIIQASKNQYKTQSKTLKLTAGKSKTFCISQTFIFPEYSWKKEQRTITSINFDSVFSIRKTQKNKQLKSIIDSRKTQFQDNQYAQLLAKAHLTLQNNWRIPAGEVKYEGLFPSYHYVWFNGFWSWDSWKHAVGLSHYDISLAKKQVKLMFEFQLEDGFVADCVYRDTLIESHNWRNTKPPLSAWAVAKIYKKTKDFEFVKEIYPKLKKYHYWWYKKRDHDQDSICEYGATDGTLIAAKWESGMDNAIRFDTTKMLKNYEGAYSMNQESVDLNAYLYAEKLFLATLAKILYKNDEAIRLKAEAKKLKHKIQQQFYDTNDGWFYDTTIDGKNFIKGEGSEGWIPLWAKAATQKQAEAVKNHMMNPKKFFTKVPFQTMSADHKKFAPLKGYWRGPNWLDQAYFGVRGLRYYGFDTEADKATIRILEGANGLLTKGKSIRENYHPLTGKGLHAENFSWSAAHIMMLLTTQ